MRHDALDPTRSGKNDQKQAESLPSSDQETKNPNPRANENVRVRTEPPQQDIDNGGRIGSEITDGEDG